MNVHPQFSDSIQEYAKQRLAEWDAQNPKPPLSPEKPEELAPIVCKHNNGHALLVLNGEELQITIATPKGSFFLFMNTGLLKIFIEQLLTVENAQLEHAEWAQGGDAGRDWNIRRSRFLNEVRREFIAKYEHRDPESQKSAKNAPSCCWHCDSKRITKVTVKNVETYECADCRTWLGDVQEVE